MAVVPTLVLVDDPQPVFDWLTEHIARKQIVRAVARQSSVGWWVKVVFRQEIDAAPFCEHWYYRSKTLLDGEVVPPSIE